MRAPTSTTPPPPRTARRRRARALAALAGGAIVLLTPGTASPAHAQTDVVLSLEDDVVDLTRTDDGGLTGDVTITNLGGEPVTAGLSGQGAVESCTFTASPETVPAARTVSVTFTAEDCVLPANGAEARLVLGGSAAGDVAVTLQSDPPEAADTSWAWFFVLGLGAAVATVLLVWVRRPTVLPTPTDPAADPVPVAASWRTELPGLGSGWELSSWASNVTVVATTFAAFLGSTDLLTAVFGAEPEDAVAQILVAGAVAVFLLAAAPVVLRLVGPRETPTVGGLLLAALVTLTAAIGQVLTIGWTLRAAGISSPFDVVAPLLAVLASLTLVVYGARTLRFRLADGVAVAPAPPSAEVLVAAALVLRAVHPQGTPQETWHADLHAIAEEITQPPGAPEDYPGAGYSGLARKTSRGDLPTGVL